MHEKTTGMDQNTSGVFLGFFFFKVCYFTIFIYFKIIIQGKKYKLSRLLRKYTTVSAVGVHACGAKNE